ncbi:MAG: carboxypeptidase-like regulatory domain-containing protein [Planctomycetota bacterium]|nr:carboxypeptidase-like regulatory domain-containing protein [Planctomycetota bacterium]
MFSHRIKFVIWGAMCASFIGCGSGSGLVQAKGKVTYNGQPVAGAAVTFLSSTGRLAIGTTDAKGEFSMNTQGLPGISLGSHQVGITKHASSGEAKPMTPDEMLKAQAATMGKAPVAEKSEIPEKYAAPQTSGLRADASADKSKNVFDFPLSD